MTPWKLRETVRALHSGGIIAYPTETLYGLGCNPLDGVAIMQLLALKQRPVEKGLILIAAHIEQLSPYIDKLNATQRHRLEERRTAPTTWLLNARPTVPGWLTGNHETIAVRITQHPVAATLCDAFGGALVSTSANFSQRPVARNYLQIRHRFGTELTQIINSQNGMTQRASEIVDMRNGRVVRV